MILLSFDKKCFISANIRITFQSHTCSLDGNFYKAMKILHITHISNNTCTLEGPYLIIVSKLMYTVHIV